MCVRIWTWHLSRWGSWEGGLSSDSKYSCGNIGFIAVDMSGEFTVIAPYELLLFYIYKMHLSSFSLYYLLLPMLGKVNFLKPRPKMSTVGLLYFNHFSYFRAFQSCNTHMCCVYFLPDNSFLVPFPSPSSLSLNIRVLEPSALTTAFSSPWFYLSPCTAIIH